jgi:hypothetical protein
MKRACCQANRQKSCRLKKPRWKAALPNRKLLEPRKMVLSTSKKAASIFVGVVSLAGFFGDVGTLPV